MLIIPVYNTIILPDVQYNLEPDILNEKEKKSVQENDTILLLPLKEGKNRENLSVEDFYEIGLLGTVKAIRSSEEGFVLAVHTDKSSKSCCR